MNGKYNWSAEKKDLKKLKVNDLMEKLQEMETERFRLETHMRSSNGSSVHIRNYPSEPQLRPYGNLKKIKKTIAYIKTILNIKMKHGKRR